jgi:hypothetical protein
MWKFIYRPKGGVEREGTHSSYGPAFFTVGYIYTPRGDFRGYISRGKYRRPGERGQLPPGAGPRVIGVASGPD